MDSWFAPVLSITPLLITLVLGLWMTIDRFKSRQVRVSRILTMIELQREIKRINER